MAWLWLLGLTAHPLASSVGKKKPPQEAGAWGLIKPRSLGVGNAPVGQAWMWVMSDFRAAGVVMLTAVGQLNTRFG